MAQTPMGPNFLQPFQILTKFTLHLVRQNLAVFAIVDVALPVKEPGRNLVLGRVLDDRDDPFELF